MGRAWISSFATDALIDAGRPGGESVMAEL